MKGFLYAFLHGFQGESGMFFFCASLPQNIFLDRQICFSCEPATMVFKYFPWVFMAITWCCFPRVFRHGVCCFTLIPQYSGSRQQPLGRCSVTQSCGAIRYTTRYTSTGACCLRMKRFFLRNDSTSTLSVLPDCLSCHRETCMIYLLSQTDDVRDDGRWFTCKPAPMASNDVLIIARYRNGHVHRSNSIFPTAACRCPPLLHMILLCSNHRQILVTALKGAQLCQCF